MNVDATPVHIERSDSPAISDWVDAIWWPSGNATEPVFWRDVLPDKQGVNSFHSQGQAIRRPDEPLLRQARQRLWIPAYHRLYSTAQFTGMAGAPVDEKNVSATLPEGDWAGSSMNIGASHNLETYFFEMPAPAAIAEWVDMIWWMRGDETGHVFKPNVLPDGCADLLFYADKHGVRSVFVGPVTRWWTMSISKTVSMAGIRFRPGALGGIAKVPLVEIQNGSADPTVLPLSDIKRLMDAVAARCTPDVLVEHFVRLLKPWHNLNKSVHNNSRAVSMLGEYAARNEGITVSRLATTVGMSVRTLRRIFSNEVGLAPKLFARVMRMQGMLREMEVLPLSPRWADFAARLGYADQAHMIREFRDFTGMTPAAYLAAMKNGRFVQ